MGLKIALCFFTVCILASCNKNVVFSKYERIEETKGWPAKQLINFETEMTDTNQLYDVYINVRNAETYPFKNLFMFLHTTYPNGTISLDTIECVLASEQGHWLGKGLGDLYDNTILFKKNARFKHAGKYKFAFEQVMRYGNKNEIDPLFLIMDIGITIEKATE
ncbi:MAG: gliding motility lipoprotein GldH [Bacteroidia bacterium]